MTDTLDAPGTAPAEQRQPYTTDRLARMVTETRFEDLPESAVAATRRLILDEIVVTAATYDTPMAKALYRLRGDRGGSPEATLMVDGRKVPAASAAYIHAQLANLLDADETTHNRMHTLSASVMAGLAVAELTGASGQDLITSIATGYEITARVGTSIKQWVPDGNGGITYAPLFGWSWMSLGAAATAGHLLKLDPLSMARGFGQAFVTTPVYFDVLRNADRVRLAEKPATWHKYQTSGASSAAGVEAALLAADGWIAQEDILDPEAAFWKSFAAPGCDYDVLYSQIGERWRIQEVSIKPYPFCRYGHGALDVMTSMVAEHGIRPEDIERIDLRIPKHTLFDDLARTVHPKESLGLMGSLPTALALVALGVPPGPKWFLRDFSDPQVRGIAQRVHYEFDERSAPLMQEELNRDGYNQLLPLDVTVRTTSGAEYTAHADYAFGDPWYTERPYGDEDAAGKARSFLDGILPAAKIEQLIEASLTVDKAGDISAIAAAMAR